jgi:uncharacterized protein YeaO (DUF488 family)
MAAKPVINVKRVYDEPAASDGMRILVDRLWPRGLTKAEVKVDEWLRGLAPSNELRKWFHTHTEERQEFRKRYVQELCGAEAGEDLSRLRDILSKSRVVTLLFASKSTDFNNATVLREVLAGKNQAR